MGAMESPKRRTVSLRTEEPPGRYHALWAYVDEEGALHVDGVDQDPALEAIAGKEEVETFCTVRAEHVGALVGLLGGSPGGDVLDLLAERYTGEGSYELKRVLASRAVPVERFAV